MSPLFDSVSGTDQAPDSSSSTTVSPSFSSFQFRTIGKQPDLLKRISAPEPNQDYQDDSTPCPSPSHSPALEHNHSKPSLFQKLTNGNSSETNTVSHTIGNAPSDLDPGKTSSAFDPVFATLFSANVQPLSILAVGRRPKSPSDMEMSSAGTTPRIARSLSLTQPAPTNGAVGLTADNTRFTSVDLLNGLELAYPATEDLLSALQEQSDSQTRADTSPDQGFSARLNNVIAYLESKSLQQSKVLAAIASLERDFQLVASQTSLALEKANTAEAAAEKSFGIAKDALAVAQHSVAAANVANTGVENALVALIRLRQCYADEHAANEHDRADLLCKMTSLKRDIELFPTQGSSCNTGTGLGSDVLRILSTEAMKLVSERDLGAKKRKRSLDKMDQSNTCDLTSRPLKEARHECPILFFDRTVESEAETAREAWIQEVERRSAVPPDDAQRTAHEQKEKEAMTRGPKDLVVEEDDARNGPTQSQLVNEDVGMSSDKLDAENGARENSHSEESSETNKELRAQWEREVVEHKLEIARFQMQERDLKEKGKRKEVEGNATTASEQTEQSAPLRTRPPPTFVPATTTAANTLERNAHQTSQPKPGLSDASRLEKIQMRLAHEKQRASPAIGQGSSLAPSAAQTLSQQNVLQEAPRSVADTGRSDFQGQGQTNDGVAGKVRERCEKGREIDDSVTGAKPRGQGMLINTSSVDAKDTSKVIFGNVTAQKTLTASAQLKRATSPQSGKTSLSTAANPPVPQHLLLHPLPPLFAMVPPMAIGTNYGSFPLNDPLSQPLQPRDQDTRRASLPPIECLLEPDQAESARAIKCPPSSRTTQKRKQGVKRGKSRPNAGNIRGVKAQPSSTEPDPHKTDAASNAPAVPPLALASSDRFPKQEVISPTLPSLDQHIPAQEIRSSPSIFSLSVQPVTASLQQKEHIVSPAPMSTSQPSRDNHQVSSGSEPKSKLPSETAERGPHVEPMNPLQPLPVNGQVIAAAERVSKPPFKTTFASPAQTGNASAFLKTPHGGHREISGSAANIKPTGLVHHSPSGKAPLSTNGQQVAHDPRGEISTSLDSIHATIVDSSLGAPAANVNTPTARSSMSENPPAGRTSLNPSQAPSSNGPSTGVSIQHSNPLPLTMRVETSQLPTYSNSARPEARLSRSRSRSSPSSSPSPITNRKRNWNVMEGDHWSPGQDVRGRRPRTNRMPPPPLLRSRSPIARVSLIQRLSDSAPHVGHRTGSSYRSKGDTYRPDESPPYYSGEDDIDRARNQSKPLFHRFQDPTHMQGHNESVPSKRPKLAPPRSNSNEGRGGALTLQERIS